ncbi:hypothetical protein TW95_gp0656 [Pandoravirus inopinatum]|uniref:Uncharacterized protein n=1 Tax=Pandoravirus inopinatum TaxID=1605721 RepID=A0A0B5J6K1_9VIRU|nr:hypothetical protein TW95_gp0656 [Pandoravirus inopinatum]AJF97390.1 hypothetical protein [Pandoravirus inopinatum]
MQNQEARGQKRRMPAPRQYVTDAVTICNSPTKYEGERLDAILWLITGDLGLLYAEGGDTCATLEAALGDEWDDAQALLRRDKERQARARTTLATFYTRPPADMIATIETDSRTMDASPTEPSALWSNLPGELRMRSSSVWPTSLRPRSWPYTRLIATHAPSSTE